MVCNYLPLPLIPASRTHVFNDARNNMGVLERFSYDLFFFHKSAVRGTRAISRNKGYHDVVIKWKHFSRYWPFVRGIHWSPVNSPHKCQCRGPLMFFFICARINDWVNKREACDLRRRRAHYDVTVMINGDESYPKYFRPSSLNWNTFHQIVWWCQLFFRKPSKSFPFIHWIITWFSLQLTHTSLIL